MNQSNHESSSIGRAAPELINKIVTYQGIRTRYLFLTQLHLDLTRPSLHGQFNSSMTHTQRA